MAIAIQRVVRTERNDVPARQDMGQAAFHHPAGVEGVRIEECRQGDAKYIRPGQLGSERLGGKVALDWRRATFRSAATVAGRINGARYDLLRPVRRVNDRVG